MTEKRKPELETSPLEQITGMLAPREAEFEVPYGVEEVHSRLRAEFERGSVFIGTKHKIEFAQISDDSYRFTIRRQAREMTRFIVLGTGMLYAYGDGSTRVRLVVGNDLTAIFGGVLGVGVALGVLMLFMSNNGGFATMVYLLFLVVIGLVIAYAVVSHKRTGVINEIKRALLV